MACISRLFLFNSTLFKLGDRLNKRGVSAANLSQKFLPLTSYLEPYSFFVRMISSEIKLTKNDFKPTHIYHKNKLQLNKTTKRPINSKFDKFRLSVILSNAKNLPPGYLIGAFNRLCFIYLRNKDNIYFQNELEFFTKSPDFKKFCQLIEDNLQKFTPPNLAVLINLVHFKVPLNSVLMRKLLTLILDNIHAFPIIDLLDLYCELQRNCFNSIKECKKIVEACELYFDTALKDELPYYQNLKDLVYFISEKNLPLHVRRLIVEKFLDEIDMITYELSIFPKFFAYALREPILSLYKTSLLKQLKTLLHDHEAPQVQSTFIKIYAGALRKYDYIYDGEICDKIIANACGLYIKPKGLAFVSCQLSDMGHFSREIVDKMVDGMLATDILNLKANNISLFASAFLRTSYHEMNNPNWSEIKNQIQQYIKVKGFDNAINHNVIEQLTFLGFDTTDLLKRVFEAAENIESYDDGDDCRTILRLYHLSQKYFPDSQIGLSKKALKNHLQCSSHKKSFLHNTVVGELFGSPDYVLPNCWTSDFHVLPLVVILGADNKPIDLSAYKPDNQEIELHKNFRVITNIDNIKKPPGSKVIAFVKYPDSQPYQFRNAPLISGHWRMFIKAYEGINCHIIPLNINYFYFDKEKKLEYLNSEVNKIIEKSQTTA